MQFCGYNFAQLNRVYFLMKFVNKKYLYHNKY